MKAVAYHGGRAARQVIFIVGVACGRGMLNYGELGPLDNGGQLQVFEDDDW